MNEIRKLIASYEIRDAFEAMEESGIDVADLRRRFYSIDESNVIARNEKEDEIIEEMINLLK